MVWRDTCRSTTSLHADGSLLGTGKVLRHMLSHRTLAHHKGRCSRSSCPFHSDAGNGAVVQNSNTSNLIFRIPALIAFISAAITLEPGDIIATGTADGVGVFRKPPVFLKSGDVMEVDIEGLGVLKNYVV